jgi:hypothetical protein
MIPPHPVSESVLTVRRLTIVLALVFPSVLAAQDSIPPADSTQFEAPADSTQFEAPADSTAPPVSVERDSLGRPIIEYVELRRSDIFDSTEAKSWLPRLVNGLHVMTRPGIISRELLLKVGEPYDSARVAETARNLRTLGIFRKVTIDSVTTDSGFALKVFAQDGWTTQADLRFRSAGSQTDYQISLIERNLIGTATRFAVRYRHTPDRDIFAFQFLQPRLLVRTVSLGLRYESRSDGTRAAIAVDRPFFSLSDRAGFQTLFDIRNERVLQFRNGLADPSDSLRRRFVIGRVVAAQALRASSQGYVRVGLSAQVRREDYTIWPVQPAGRSVTATVGPFIEWRRANFVVTRGFARQGREEDVDLSNLARLELLAAPEFLGYDTDGVGLLAQVRVGTKMPQGFAWIDSRANGVFNGGGLDSGSVTVGGTFVVAPMRRHLLVGHADIGWIRNPLPATEFDLGFALGPRAFPIHAFTGDRTYFTTAEYRYTIGEDLFKALDLGLAGFVDHGGAWYRTQPRRTGTDVGLGIRLSPSRAGDANTTRLDLAYRFKNDQEKAGWVFVIASGLVFNSNPR